MSDQNVVSSPVRTRRRWLKWVLWIAGGMVGLIVILYFIVTSSAFLEGVVLPRVGQALNCKITVTDASIHPFSQVVLQGLTVQPTGQEVLVSAPEVRADYHLWDIIHGNLRVDNVALASPTINLVQNPDGSRNLDPILRAMKSTAAPETKPAASAKPAKPLQVDLGKLSIEHAEIRSIKKYADGRQDCVDLTNLDLTLTDLKNGGTAKLQTSAELQVTNNPPTAAGGALAASLKASFSVGFSADLKPGTVTGDASCAVSQSSGVFQNLGQFGVAVNCNVMPEEIKQLAIQFQKAGVPLGELSVSGPFDATKMEGTLAVTLRGIDRRLLNLAGARSGVDFGTTTMDANTEIRLANHGASIEAVGQFNAAKVQLTRTGLTTPTLDFNASYDVALDRAANSATIKALNVVGKQNGVSLLDADLSSPMNVAWGGSAGTLGDASLNLMVTGLNLADWKAFLGTVAPAGKVNLKAKILSQKGGQNVTFDVNSAVGNLTVDLGSNRISQADVNVSIRGQAAQLKQLSLNACNLQVSLQGQPALTVSGAGTYDLSNGAADLQLKLEAMLARLTQALPQPGLTCSSGQLDLNAHVTQKDKAQTISGKLALGEFDGDVGKNMFQNYAANLNFNVANSAGQIQIKQLAGDLSQHGNAGGNFSLSGSYNIPQKAADVEIKLSGLNQNALQPFLQPLLAGKGITSVALSGDISARYSPQSGSALKGNVQVANLVVTSPGQSAPAQPLGAGFQIDASLDKQIAELRQLTLSLTPTARGTNQLQVSGRVDFSQSDAIQGNLKLAADSLDLTSYYDLFVGATNRQPAKAAAPAAAATPANQEPPAVKLPVKEFTLAVNIGQIYLHEVAISNLQTTVAINGNNVGIKPFQLVLNGAPVNATASLDLGVPGYMYAVTLDGRRIPIGPFVDTFKPEYAGQLGGVLTAAVQIKGAGVTGPSLKKNLNGQLDLEMTNLDLSVNNVKNPVIKLIVNVVATIPELISSPENAVVSLVGGITGHGGLTDELTQAPIELIAVKAAAGNGQVNFQHAVVQSAVFEADGDGGTIALADVITNSAINIPVTISLSQSVAKKLNINGTGAGSNPAYVPLPQFFTETGTLGTPKENISKLKLTVGALKTIGGALLNPSTNSPVGNLLNQVQSTNSPVGNLLNQLFKGGK